MSDYRDRVYERGGGRPELDHPYHRSTSRVIEHSPSPDRYGFERRPRFHDELSDGGPPDDLVRDRRHHHDEPRYVRREPRGHSPVYETRRPFIDIDRERGRDYVRTRSPSPPGPAALRPQRPGVLRRQSSLDTFDRPRFYDREREEYPPPARRDEFRASYGSIPIPPPGSRRLDYDDDVRAVPLPRGYEQDRVREKEVVRVRKRRSRDSLTSKTVSRRSSSSSSSSRSSSPSRATSVRNEYPKRGKTKIPAKLLSKRALMDLGYPFIDEGNLIILLKALSQEQIDEVLRVSEEYKKAELEISTARSSAGDMEERLEEVRFSQPVVVAQPPEVDIVKETVIRDVSPSRGTSVTTTTLPSTSTACSTCTSTTGDTVVVGPGRRRRYSSGPLVVRSKSRSRSRGGKRELRAEIRALEAELYEKKHGRHHHHHGGELVHVGDGERVVLMEEKVEKVTEGYRGPRIERDKKGRMSLSVPRRR